MAKLTERMITKVVNYWGDKIMTHPKQGDNAGIDGDKGRVLNILGAILSDGEVTPESDQKFKESLTKLLQENTDVWYDDISVDYHPGKYLKEAAKEAGISTDVFPFKHTMVFNFNDNTVQVREGYGAPFKEVE